MRWGMFCTVTIAAGLIMWFEWRNMKQKPLKDRVVFVALLLIAWVLSMLDLPNTPGPTTIYQIIFKPLKGLID